MRRGQAFQRLEALSEVIKSTMKKLSQEARLARTSRESDGERHPKKVGLFGWLVGWVVGYKLVEVFGWLAGRL